MKKIGIIGGGAAGMVAAITAARNGAEVTIIERQNRLGKKILVTGNGRCNITNTVLAPKNFHTHSTKVPFDVIEQFGYTETLAFFEQLGIEPLIEKAKVYPLSEQASSVLDVLRLEIIKLDIQVITDEKIIQIAPEAEGFLVESETGSSWRFDKVIVATGGMAAPQLGCDQTGYQVLKKLGHKSYETFPTLVHMTSGTPFCKMLQGIRVKGQVSIWQDELKIREEFGEVLFTEDGLSGPPIFQLSRVAAQSAIKSKDCQVVLDLFPKVTMDELVGKIYDRIAQNPDKTIEEMYIGWLHKKVTIAVIKAAQVGSPTAKAENLDYEMIMRLAHAMKQLTFKITGTRGFKFAQATAGGIRLEEINLETMESLLHKGLYLIGEVVDVDGDCGGYNLQWAWSSAFVAGQHVAY